MAVFDVGSTGITQNPVTQSMDHPAYGWRGLHSDNSQAASPRLQKAEPLQPSAFWTASPALSKVEWRTGVTSDRRFTFWEAGGSADTAAALGLGLHFTARTNPVLDQQLTQWYTINSQLGLPQGWDVALKCTGKCKPLQSVLLPPFKNKAVLNTGTQQEEKTLLQNSLLRFWQH